MATFELYKEKYRYLSRSEVVEERREILLSTNSSSRLAEVIIAEYDAILSQWERANFYNQKTHISCLFLPAHYILATIDISFRERIANSRRFKTAFLVFFHVWNE